MIASLLKPFDPTSLHKIGSKDLVDLFIKSDEDAAEIDVEMTGRPFDSVHAALKLFLQRHPALGVSVRMVRGKIVLTRDRGVGYGKDHQ